MTKSLTIIGSGIIGSAIAYELSCVLNDQIIVIEKDSTLYGDKQSTRNSGVFHAGIYYDARLTPLKANLCVKGNQLAYQFCDEFGVSYAKTGKIVVVSKKRQLPYLEDLLRISKENGVEHQTLTPDDIKKHEPNVSGIAGAYFPSSGIVEPVQYLKTLQRLSKSNGVIFLPGNKVIKIQPKGSVFDIVVELNGKYESFESNRVINAGGLYSDTIAKMVNPDFAYELLPLKAEAVCFNISRENINTRHNVYPVPHGFFLNGKSADIEFDEFYKLYENKKIKKTTGVHLTPTLEKQKRNFTLGNIITVGPLISRTGIKDDYNPEVPIDSFHERIKKFFPHIKRSDLVPYQVGILAKLKDHEDFLIQPDNKYENFINLVGIDSPGLTSSLAIAKYVKNMI